MMVEKQIAQGIGTWSTLSAEMQEDMNLAISNWQASAEEGNLDAQYNLGNLSNNGHGMPHSI